MKKNVRLILAGSGLRDFRQSLIEEAKKLNLNVAESLGFSDDADVVFAGNVSDQELATIYRGSHLFVSLSEHEGFCVPLVEAMFFGLPIVAHEAAAIPETLNNGGILVNKFNFQSLVKQIEMVLENSELASDLSSKSLARAQNYSMSRLESAFDKCFEQTLDRYHSWFAEKPLGFRF